jgi:ABC-2 type transport system ATP-binding protein
LSGPEGRFRTTVTAAVEAKDLTFSYKYRVVVNQARFSVQAGSITGFLGPNGAGKTTTMFCLIGALRPKSGRLEVFGQDPNGSDPEVKRRIGFASEQPAFYNHLSVYQNLLFAGRMLSKRTEETKGRVKELSESFGFEQYVQRKPWTLSHGFRQRVAIAEALVGDPDLLILDEPTTGLDPSSMIRIRDQLLKMNKDRGTTILVSSHNLHLLERTADHYIFLAKGTVSASGTMKELSEKFGHLGKATIETGELSQEVQAGLKKECEAIAHYEDGTVTVTDDPSTLTRVLAFLISKGVIVRNAGKLGDALEAIYMRAVGSSETINDAAVTASLKS